MPTDNQRLPKCLRLRLRTDFQTVRKEGSSVRDGMLRISYRRREDGATRLGLAISRRMGCAVKRNRIKRALREAYRRDRTTYPRSLDLVISAIDSHRASDLTEVRRSLRSLLRRAAERLEARR